ncbi:Tetratricopeptide repeat protein 30A [Homalodisca vitripennis]|nr:Tetratricopeptide repeat protein 30A [Homalodisca vitripennis]
MSPCAALNINRLRDSKLSNTQLQSRKRLKVLYPSEENYNCLWRYKFLYKTLLVYTMMTSIHDIGNDVAVLSLYHQNYFISIVVDIDNPLVLVLLRDHCPQDYRIKIKDQQYSEALQILNGVLTANPNSRACLSLLAYCYFYTQDFVSAANCYERLVALVPEEQDYQLYYAQCLYQACLYQDALRIVSQIEDPSVQPKVRKLKAAIKYGEEDLVSAKVLMESSPEDDPDTEINHGCLLYKEMRYEEALQKFTTALVVLGYNPHLSYNVALCYYRLKEYAPALKHIADIIERGIREHPELSVGMATEGIEVRSVGNTLTLHETALIEAFNLKAAIEYQLNNLETAREALTDMPPRSEEELDAVTLHNQALMNMESKPHEGFEKLQFLLQQNPFPPETLGNLLLLYCRYQCFDLAADVLADNTHLTHKYLSPYLYDFLDALITQQSSPEEAYRKFDELASRHTDVLRKATRRVQEARESHNDAAVKKAVTEYEDTLDRCSQQMPQE